MDDALFWTLEDDLPPEEGPECPVCRCPIEEGECYCTLPEEMKITAEQMERGIARVLLVVTARMAELRLLRSQEEG